MQNNIFPSIELVATAYTKKQLLDPTIRQVALAGRSNVGKSSLINALAGRKQLAKTSGTPGKTRSINYYTINSSAADNVTPQTPHYLVDLPGYGYAKCSKDERNAWAELLEYYFLNTSGLCAIALLIDSRHTPQKLDIQLAQMALASRLLIIPVLTKIDKSKKKEQSACIAGWTKILGGITPILTSSEKKQGLDELWQALLTVLHAS